MGKTPELRNPSALDYIDLYGLDLYPSSLKPSGRLLERIAGAFQFKADDADFIAHLGLTDVGDQIELGGEFPNHRAGDEPGRVHQP